MMIEQKRDFKRYMAACWSRKTNQTVVEWAEENVTIGESESDWHGPFRVARTPHMAEPLECFRDNGVKSVTMVYGTQVCKTFTLILGMLWTLANRSGNALWVMDSVDNVRDFSRDRWNVFIDGCKALANLRSTITADTSNLRQKIAGSVVYFVGSNSAGRLASKPVSLVIMDEVGKFAAATDSESDSVDNAEQRTKAKAHGKHIKASSPTDDVGLVWLEFLAGDQRCYFMPCVHCGEWIRFTWEDVEWDSAAKGPGGWDYERVKHSAHYKCPECSGKISDSDKTQMLRAGQWRPTRQDAPAGVRSYHCSSLYSIWPACSWGNLAVQYLQAKSKNKLEGFRRNWLALPTTTLEEQIKPDDLRHRQEEYKQAIPDQVLILTGGADVQGDRIETELVGWGLGEESWSIDYQIFWGDPNKPDVWNELDEWIKRERGARLRAFGIDSGDHPDRVYRFTRPRESLGVYALKGSSTGHRPIASKPSRVRKGRVKLHSVGTDTAKDLIYSNLRLTEPGPGYCHFPHETETGQYGAEYFAQLTAETKKPVTRRHNSDYVYVKTRARNEALDCRVYATHALFTLSANVLEAEHKRRAQEGNAQTPGARQPAPRRAANRTRRAVRR
jgi:phage terminase large subunit GpA-like protein